MSIQRPLFAVQKQLQLVALTEALLPDPAAGEALVHEPPAVADQALVQAVALRLLHHREEGAVPAAADHQRIRHRDSAVVDHPHAPRQRAVLTC